MLEPFHQIQNCGVSVLHLIAYDNYVARASGLNTLGPSCLRALLLEGLGALGPWGLWVVGHWGVGIEALALGALRP